MDLVIDIFCIIIDFLPICDTRNLLRCSKKLHLLSTNKVISSIININSLNWENKLNSDLPKWDQKFYINNSCSSDVFINIKREYLSVIEKYTFENICYGYVHLIPNKYMTHNNIMGNYLEIIHINAGYSNFLDLIKFCNPMRFYVSVGAAMNGNLKIFKLFHTKHYGHGYAFNDNFWEFVIKLRQLQILKWAKNNGYTFNTHVFKNAIENKHLNILKWAYKHNFIE